MLRPSFLACGSYTSAYLLFLFRSFSSPAGTLAPALPPYHRYQQVFLAGSLFWASSYSFTQLSISHCSLQAPMAAPLQSATANIYCLITGGSSARFLLPSIPPSKSMRHEDSPAIGWRSTSFLQPIFSAGNLTIHSSRSRFAARLNSGVRHYHSSGDLMRLIALSILSSLVLTGCVS